MQGDMSYKIETPSACSHKYKNRVVRIYVTMASNTETNIWIEMIKSKIDKNCDACEDCCKALELAIIEADREMPANGWMYTLLRDKTLMAKSTVFFKSMMAENHFCPTNDWIVDEHFFEIFVCNDRRIAPNEREMHNLWLEKMDHFVQTVYTEYNSHICNPISLYW